MYARVKENRKQASGTYRGTPSKKNWTLRSQIELSDRNKSPEVVLERKIVKALRGRCFNQMPTASGLVNQSADKRRAIDLVYKRGKDSYEFIELKVDSDTPLFAAIEILGYGILYLYTRCELAYRAGDKPVLRAKDVGLRVLAPAIYFEGLDFAWLEEGLNDGLSRFLDRLPDLNLRLDFRFDAFPPRYAGQDLNGDPVPAFEARRAIYSRA